MSYQNAGRVGLLGAPTYPMLRDATLTALLAVLDQNNIPYSYNKGQNVLSMQDTNSTILLRSIDEFERLRGTNLAWFGIDELSYAPEESWLRLEGRLRDPLATKLSGFAVWTPKGFDWVYKRFIKEPVAGYDTIISTPFENRHILDKIPDFYERLRASYGESFFRQEVLGEYLNAGTGLVYESFSRQQHTGNLKLNSYLPILWAVDFNVEPMCSIVAQVQGEDVYVLDEIVIDRASTDDACQEFLNRYPRHAGGVVVYGDASGNNLKTSGTTDYEMIKRFFARSPYQRVTYRVPKSNPAVRDRILVVNAKLKNAFGETHLMVSQNCKELIKDFEEVMFKPDTWVIEKTRDPRRTHLSDALGYLIWQESLGQRNPGERSTRVI